MATNGEQMVTLSSVVPWYNLLLNHCMSYKRSNSSNPTLTESDLYDAAEAAGGKLKKYYNCSSEHCTLAVLLDPRMKLEFYQDQSFSPQKQLEENLEKETQLRDCLLNYSDEPDAPVELESQRPDENDPLGHMKPVRVIDEVGIYLNNEPRINSKDDPLLWWKLNSSRFPHLSKAAKEYLVIPGTSAPSERAFSASGALITVRRCRLSDQTIRASMCLRSWIKSGLI
jgi:hypothetical protein